MINIPYKSGIVRVSSPYGNRVLNNSPDYHNGVDLVGVNKTIVAPIDGIVRSSTIITDTTNRTWEWGNYIKIEGVDGRMYYFCHLSQRNAVVGEYVHAGDEIGVEGNTGYSFGSHLHFEVRENGYAINPCNLLGIQNQQGAIVTVESSKTNSAERIIEKNDVSDFARDAVIWSLNKKIVYGDGNGNLMLKEPCTREQMLTFLYRFAKNVLEDDGK